MNQMLVYKLSEEFSSINDETFKNVEISFYTGKETKFEPIKFKSLDFESIFKTYQFDQTSKINFIASVYTDFKSRYQKFHMEQDFDNDLKELELEELEIEEKDYLKNEILAQKKKWKESFYIQSKIRNDYDNPTMKKLQQFVHDLIDILHILEGELRFLTGTPDNVFGDYVHDLGLDLNKTYNIDNKRKDLTKYNLSLNPYDGSKTDIRELLFVLSKSNLIFKDGREIQHKELTEMVGNLLNINLSKPFDGIKQRSDNTFIDKLKTLLTEYKLKDPRK